MSAIFSGPKDFTLADYFEAPVNALPGDALAFTVSLLCVILSQAVTSATRYVFHQRNGNPGWNFHRGGTNASMGFSVGNGSGSGTAPGSAISAADVGRVLLYTGTWDGLTNTIRLYAKRVQVGSGTNFPGGYAPVSTAPRIGLLASPADGLAFLGGYYAPGLASLAQVQAQYDHVMATERMQACPGLPGVIIDPTRDIAENGGTMPAALLGRAASGNISFAKVGAPPVHHHYHRAYTW